MANSLDQIFASGVCIGCGLCAGMPGGLVQMAYTPDARLRLAGATADPVSDDVAEICCFTPFLPWLLGAIGASGLLGYVYRDDVLLPVLAGSLILAGIGFWWGRRPE